jgi:hypothetical protein
MTPSLKTWWQGLKYWQKGALIGPLFIIVYILVIILTLKLFGGNIPDWLNYGINFSFGLPYMLSALIFRQFGYVTFGYIWYIILLGLLFYIIFGALIGLIIGKVKGK